MGRVVLGWFAFVWRARGGLALLFYGGGLGIGELGYYLLVGFAYARQLFGPGAAGVQNVPLRLLLALAAAAGVVVAEAIHLHVPDGAKHIDKQRLAQRNPDGIHRQVAAGEIREVKARPYDNGFGVLTQSVVQGAALRFARHGDEALAGTLRHSLAHIDGHVLDSLALVKRVRASVKALLSSRNSTLASTMLKVLRYF